MLHGGGGGGGGEGIFSKPSSLQIIINYFKMPT